MKKLWVAVSNCLVILMSPIWCILIVIYMATPELVRWFYSAGVVSFLTGKKDLQDYVVKITVEIMKEEDA